MLEKNGLVKLVEECSELAQELIELRLLRSLARLGQVSAKKITRMDSDEHWDEQGSLKERLENEIADVTAACQIVINNFNLDDKRMKNRSREKFELFKRWMNEPDETVKPKSLSDNEVDAYNFYMSVIENSHIRYLPVTRHMDTPLDKLKDPLDVIVRVRERLIVNIRKYASEQARNDFFKGAA